MGYINRKNKLVVSVALPKIKGEFVIHVVLGNYNSKGCCNRNIRYSYTCLEGMLLTFYIFIIS